MSLENQARLKEVIILLNKDTISLVQDADQIKDLLELIDQDIPSALKAPLESAAHLDDHFAMVKRATKNTSSRAALQKDRSLKKLEIKDLHSHIQTTRNSLATLEPELRSMEDEKIRLEAQLAELNAKIQSHRAHITNLPKNIEATSLKIASTIKEDQQIKNKLSSIQSSEDEDHKVLDNVSRIRTEAIEAINHLLNQ